MSRNFDATRLQPVTNPTMSSVCTITCWIYNETVESYGAMWVNNPNLGFFMRSTTAVSHYTATDKLSTANYTLNTWSHFAYTQTGAGVGTFYKNGVTNGTITATNSYTIVDIGEDAVSETFKGRLWDLRFYNVVLTQQEILSCMRGRIVRPSQLSAWYPFEGSSTPEPERSANRRNAALASGPNARNSNPPTVSRPFF